jgi:hypothetical protein
MAEWFLEKRPVFLSRTDFDASETGRRFDFVLSHSILSHAAHWQLPVFLAHVAAVLSSYGTAVVWLRMHDEHGTHTSARHNFPSAAIRPSGSRLPRASCATMIGQMR